MPGMIGELTPWTTIKPPQGGQIDQATLDEEERKRLEEERKRKIAEAQAKLSATKTQEEAQTILGGYPDIADALKAPAFPTPPEVPTWQEKVDADLQELQSKLPQGYTAIDPYASIRNVETGIPTLEITSEEQYLQGIKERAAMMGVMVDFPAQDISQMPPQERRIYRDSLREMYRSTLHLERDYRMGKMPEGWGVEIIEPDLEGLPPANIPSMTPKQRQDYYKDLESKYRWGWRYFDDGYGGSMPEPLPRNYRLVDTTPGGFQLSENQVITPQGQELTDLQAKNFPGVIERLGGEFSEADITQLKGFAETKPEEFVKSVQRAGNTPLTQAALKRMGLSNAEIEIIFPQAKEEKQSFFATMGAGVSARGASYGAVLPAIGQAFNWWAENINIPLAQEIVFDLPQIKTRNLLSPEQQAEYEILEERNKELGAGGEWQVNQVRMKELRQEAWNLRQAAEEAEPTKYKFGGTVETFSAKGLLAYMKGEITAEEIPSLGKVDMSLPTATAIAAFAADPLMLMGGFPSSGAKILSRAAVKILAKDGEEAAIKFLMEKVLPSTGEKFTAEQAKAVVYGMKLKGAQIAMQKGIPEVAKTAETIAPKTEEVIPKVTGEVAPKIPEVAPKVGGIVPPVRGTSTMPLGGGALRESEHFRKVNERLGGELGDNPLYKTVNLVDQSERAIKFVTENPDDARKIALGLKKPSGDLLDTTISVAYEQRQFDAGDLNEFTKVVNSLSLRKTRAGQEIAALRGVVSDTSPTHFVEQVIAERVNRVGSKLPKGAGVPVTPSLRVARAVSKETEQLAKVINSKKVDISEAQKLIDSLGVVGDRLKLAFKNGELTIDGLYNTTSTERRAMFEQFSDTETARALNAKFERAMLSKQKDALQNWARSITDIKKQKTILDKINELEKMGALDTESTSGFLSDLVASKLGIEATPEEVAKIKSLSEGLEGLFAKADPVLGIPDMEYWVTRKALDNYINSLNPAHQLKVATSIIGRGSMLFSVKSPLTNIISNTVMAAVEGFQRRILNVAYRGLNGKFGLAYVKKVNQIFQKSGYDISRLDAIWPSQVRLGEEVTSAQGAGAVRKVGRFYEDIVYKQLMGAPDVASSSVAFADSVDLMSTRIAKTEGLVGEATRARALDIFKDAIKIEPATPEGVLARAQGIADARFTTYTNKSGYSDVAMGIRKVMNKMSGDLRLGDQLMPFVKTPANVVSAGIDAAGVGFFKGLYKLPKAIKALRVGEPALMREVVGDFTRAGLGLTLATILAYAINPEDFVGDYDALTTKEREMATLKNAPYNSVRMGDKWISLDYFGPLASAFVGIMYGRKYGENLPKKIARYGQGAGSQLLRFPGLTEVSDMIASVKEAATSGDYGETALGITDELVAFIRSRAIPAIVSDSARALDTKERAVEAKDILAKTKAGVPGLRQTLPEKVERTTGEPIPTENPILTLLFGSRLKTARDNNVITEINRLYGAGATPTIRDIEKSSTRVQGLRDQLGQDKWTGALEYYGRTYGDRVSRKIGTRGYQRLSDEDKMKELNSIRSDVIEKMLIKYHYKKPKS